MNASVLVTGGTGGLGSAVTTTFLDAGWRVVVPWHDEREADRLDAHDRLHLLPADLTDPGDVAAVVAAAAGEADRPLRAVVNLVGGFAAGGRVHETPFEEVERLLSLNLRPTYLVTGAALPELAAAGGGAVVCVSARAALEPFSGGAGYAVAKAAVLAFSRAVAVEYRDDLVRCNAVLPSVIDTPANRASQPDADHSRWVPPVQIATTIRFLCEDASAAVSGAAVPVYGRA